MANLNRIILIGNLTNDPEVRFTVEGLQVAKFQLAVDRFAQEGAPKQVDYIDVVAWRKLMCRPNPLASTCIPQPLKPQ